MGATEEQMQFLSDAHVTHVAYILILYSIAFLLYLFVNILLHVYAVHAWPDDETNGARSSKAGHSSSRSVSIAGNRHKKTTSMMNGEANGSARQPRSRNADTQHVRDAEEFELEGLISDDEDNAGGAKEGHQQANGRTKEEV